jgi:hypothetical protein
MSRSAGNAHAMRENRGVSPTAGIFSALVCTGTLLVVTGCGGGGGSGSSNADASYLAVVTRAAYTTDSVPGYRFDIGVTSKLGKKSFTLNGSGAISERGSQGSMSMKIEGKTLTEIIDKPFIYIKAPGASTHGKPWLRVDSDVFSEAVGASSPGGSSTDPTQALSFLRSAGSVRRIGDELVRGAPATRYHAVIDFARYAHVVEPGQRAAAKKYSEVLERTSGSTTVPMDVWIDRQGRISRMSLTLSLCSPEGDKLQESLNMELHGYGAQPVLDPPSSSQVTDVTAKLKAQVAKGLEDLSCR